MVVVISSVLLSVLFLLGALFRILALLYDHIDGDGEFELDVLTVCVWYAEFDRLILLATESETASLSSCSQCQHRTKSHEEIGGLRGVVRED